jgi:hypothetical protein
MDRLSGKQSGLPDSQIILSFKFLHFKHRRKLRNNYFKLKITVEMSEFGVLEQVSAHRLRRRA